MGRVSAPIRRFAGRHPQSRWHFDFAETRYPRRGITSQTGTDKSYSQSLQSCRRRKLVMAKPLFAATITKKGESYWASYHTHRTGDRDVLDRGPFATLGAAQFGFKAKRGLKAYRSPGPRTPTAPAAVVGKRNSNLRGASDGRGPGCSCVPSPAAPS